jgi:hypothetical protein
VRGRVWTSWQGDHSSTHSWVGMVASSSSGISSTRTPTTRRHSNACSNDVANASRAAPAARHRHRLVCGRTTWLACSVCVSLSLSLWEACNAQRGRRPPVSARTTRTLVAGGGHGPVRQNLQSGNSPPPDGPNSCLSALRTRHFQCSHTERLCGCASSRSKESSEGLARSGHGLGWGWRR